MQRTRHLIAVALVATALCADRAVAGSPQVRSQPSVAGRIVQKLTTGFRRTVHVRLYPLRQNETLVPPMAVSGVRDDASPIIHLPLSPFEFRLPPPGL